MNVDLFYYNSYILCQEQAQRNAHLALRCLFSPAAACLCKHFMLTFLKFIFSQYIHDESNRLGFISIGDN